MIKYKKALAHLWRAREEILHALALIEASQDVASCVAEGGIRAAEAALAEPIEMIEDLAK